MASPEPMPGQCSLSAATPASLSPGPARWPVRMADTDGGPMALADANQLFDLPGDIGALLDIVQKNIPLAKGS